MIAAMRRSVEAPDAPPPAPAPIVAPSGATGGETRAALLARTAGTVSGDAAVTAIVVAVLVLVMQVASRFVPDYILPSPVAVARALVSLVWTDTWHVVVTLFRLGVAVVFSMGVGVALGLLMGTFRRLGPYVRALVLIDTGIPALSWMLVAVFWFKEAETRIFFILTVILLPFYALNVYEGVRALPKEWLEMIESFRPTRWQKLRYLVFPHVVPYVFLTTKSVIGYAIRMVIFAELVAAAVGVGSRMGFAQSTFRMDMVLAWTFFLVVLNLLLQVLATLAEGHFLKWRPEARVR